MQRPLIITGPLLLLAASLVAAEKSPFRRWAVVATPEVTKSGVPDLLTVGLSEDESIELVERERLQEAMRELQLAALIKADNVEQRLQLGKTLGADALMLLSIEKQQDKRRLRVVVCGAKHGVRLWDGSVAFEDAELDDLVKQCATTVSEIRQRFAGGIQHIIAVPSFVSEDFETRFAYLQSRQSERLSSALTAHTGVAVVEIEEARAILRELQDTLSGGLERPIATIVKGTYSVSPLNEQQQRHIDLKVELVRDDSRPETINKRLLLGTAGHWLATELTKRLLSAADQRAPSLGPETQKSILVRHAQRFAELGDWERSMSLREAALVVDPNDALQRALLITEYQYTISAVLAANWTPAALAKPLDPKTRAAALQRAASDYVVALNHLKYLIRNKLITRADAIGLFQTHRWYVKGRVADTRSWDQLKHSALQPACAAQRKFIKDFCTRIDKLPQGRKMPKRLSTPFYGLQYPATQQILNDISFSGYSSESLESLRDLFERILPANAKASAYVLINFRARSFATLHHADLRAYHDDLRSTYDKQRKLRAEHRAATDPATRRRLSEALDALQTSASRKPPSSEGPGPREQKARDEWLAYLNRLRQSRREVLKFYGLWGLFQRNIADSQAAAEVESQLAKLQRLDLIDEWPASYAASVLGKAESPWAKLYANQSKPVATPPHDRIRFETVSLRIEGDDGSQRMRAVKGVLRCGDCDAYWTRDRFFLMHEPGVLREVKLTDAKANHPLFWGVTWDGECIWMHAHGQGIVAMQTDGTRLATFKQPLIPGYWRGHKILGLSPRKALMVGSFGDTNRAWCAILQVDNTGKPSANAFFQAKYVPEGRAPEEVATDANVAFQPDALYQVRLPNGKDYAIVGRTGLSRLQIDLASLKVSVPDPKEIVAGASTRTDLGFCGQVFLHKGRVVIPNSGLANLPTSKQMVFHNGWLYRPGYVWMRERPETGKRERLHRNKLTHKDWHLLPGASAHYGLVAYDPHESSSAFYRIRIVDDLKEGE